MQGGEEGGGACTKYQNVRFTRSELSISARGIP